MNYLNNSLRRSNTIPWEEIDVNSREIEEVVSAFRGKVKFLADENISMEEVEFLREEGVNVKSVYELGCEGKPDSSILCLARKTKRFILTRDKGFWKVPFPQIRNIGIFLINDNGRLTQGLKWLIEAFSYFEEVWKGAKIRFSEGEILIWKEGEGETKYKIDERGRVFEWIDN